MPLFPSPILFYGDIYAAQNKIVSAKNKCPEFKWIVKSAATESLDALRTEASLSSWDDVVKVLLIKDIPNKKSIRDFLLNLSSSCPDFTKLIIWDSDNNIKVDPKTKILDKTWSEFVNNFKQIKGAKVLNCGDPFCEKEKDECIDFVVKCFENHGKTISSRDAQILINIVGYDRGLLDSDISKMCITCPDKIDASFIWDHAFPTNKEAILYKVNNILDNDNFEVAINMVDQFLKNGINENVMAEIFARKARWQMVVSHLWSIGMSWDNITRKIVEMGKFPSGIWHDDKLNTSEKIKKAEQYQSSEGILDFLTSKHGIPREYFKMVENKKDRGKTTMTRKGAEIIPMPFMADQYVNTIKNKVVVPNSNIPENELKEKVLNRGIRVYLFIQIRLANIRYGQNPTQQLYEMVKELMNYTV